MTSKLITRIKNRPSYYYFDKALKNDKIITVKYCLFTDNEFEAKAIALKIKNEADNRRNSVQTKKFIDLPLRYKIRNIQKNIKNKSHRLPTTEYKEIFEKVISDIYGITKADNDMFIDRKECQENDRAKKTRKSIKFTDIASRYAQNESKKSNSKNTGYYQRVAKALDIYFKHKQITQISYQDCEDFQLHLLNNKRLNKKTINNYTCYASRMFDYAIKIGLISQNPFKLLSSFKISKDQKSPKDNFSMDELAKIFKTDKKELKDYMAFALHTGLRLSEIWSLDESSVSERDGIKFIKVQTAKQKGGDVKFRELPIHKNIYRLSDMKWLTKIKKGKSDCNYLGKRLNKHIHAVLPDSNVSFHRLRANFASAIKNYSLENGFTDVTSVLLGHATDLATDVYAKDISLKAKLKAMNGLNIFSNL